MKPFLFYGIAQYAFQVCDDIDEAIAKIRKDISGDEPQPLVKVIDLSGIVRGKDIRLLLDNAASDSQQEKRVLIVKGIEDIEEAELRIGLEHFGAFIQAYLSHLEDDRDISFMSYDYTFNPVGLSVIVLIKKGYQNHFLKYGRLNMDFVLL